MENDAQVFLLSKEDIETINIWRKAGNLPVAQPQNIQMNYLANIEMLQVIIERVVKVHVGWVYPHHQ